MRPLFLTVICLVLLTQAEGKESGAREVTAIQEQSQGFDPHNEASLENLNSIPGRSEIEEEKKKKEERERLKELSSTLDSLLVGRPAKRTKRATKSADEIVLELDGKIKVSADFEVISIFIEKVISYIRSRMKIIG